MVMGLNEANALLRRRQTVPCIKSVGFEPIPSSNVSPATSPGQDRDAKAASLLALCYLLTRKAAGGDGAPWSSCSDRVRARAQSDYQQDENILLGVGISPA
jgi:hypothetical protein